MGDVTISGDAYFAVTPKCCMGGGHLHIGYQSGNLSAWFDAFADFLINYSPFSFIANVDVSIGIRYILKVAFVQKKFNVDFSASLHLFGPPLAGIVTVNWSIISFTIHFGNSNPKNQPLSWNDFVQVLLQNDTAKSTSMQTIVATDGLLNDPTASQEQIKASTVSDPPVTWTVNGAIFSFSFTALFPISDVQYNKYHSDDPTTKSLFNGVDEIYAKPMHISKAITSHCIVEIYDGPDATPDYKDFTIRPIIKKVPSALWGQCESFYSILLWRH